MSLADRLVMHNRSAGPLYYKAKNNSVKTRQKQ